jgi:hypothetical protein
MARGKIGNVAKVVEMHEHGESYVSIAVKTGLNRKIISQYICKHKREQSPPVKNKCSTEGCKEESKMYWFRCMWLCEKCFLSAEPSKCASLPDIKRDEIYHRTESIFDTCSQVPSRRFGGAQ